MAAKENDHQDPESANQKHENRVQLIIRERELVRACEPVRKRFMQGLSRVCETCRSV